MCIIKRRRRRRIRWRSRGRNGVERVFADALEAEFGGDELAVDREGRAGQRGGARQQTIDALAGQSATLAVAAEHLEIGQHVVRPKVTSARPAGG